MSGVKRIGPPVLEHNGLRAIDCEQCGFVHLDPLPTQKAMDKLYSDDYYQVHHAELYYKEKCEQWYWRLVYRERLQEFERLLSSTGYFALDYGAGFGWFVRAASARPDWHVIGYEPSRVAVMMSGGAISTTLYGEGYDAAHLSFVLEHVRDPLAVLRDIYDRLEIGGVLCIVVPNEGNPLQRRLMGRGRYTPLHPHHVNYFSPVSLRQLVEKAGFEVVRTTATFPIEALALAGLDYTRWKWAGPIAHYLRMVFEAALLAVAPRFKRWLFEWFASKGIGREVELWAIKV